jgi:hypothetical protein
MRRESPPIRIGVLVSKTHASPIFNTEGGSSAYCIVRFKKGEINDFLGIERLTLSSEDYIDKRKPSTLV